MLNSGAASSNDVISKKFTSHDEEKQNLCCTFWTSLHPIIFCGYRWILLPYIQHAATDRCILCKIESTDLDRAPAWHPCHTEFTQQLHNKLYSSVTMCNNMYLHWRISCATCAARTFLPSSRTNLYSGRMNSGAPVDLCLCLASSPIGELNNWFLKLSQDN